jgi:hypothetical protein
MANERDRKGAIAMTCKDGGKPTSPIRRLDQLHLAAGAAMCHDKAYLAVRLTLRFEKRPTKRGRFTVLAAFIADMALESLHSRDDDR